MIVASYNVHGCVGIDGRYDPGRIAAVIRELAADVVGLQEVDTTRTAKGDSSWLHAFAEVDGYQLIVGPTVGRGHGFYGNALLTRARVTAQRLHTLTVRRREPRGAVDVTLETAGAPVRVMVTHFGLKRWERRAQAELLAAALQADRTPALVILGDLNEWLPVSPVLRLLTTLVGPSPKARTWPAWRPLLALDRILVRPGEALRRFEAHRTQAARAASDHLPVRAVLSL